LKNIVFHIYNRWEKGTSPLDERKRPPSTPTRVTFPICHIHPTQYGANTVSELHLL